VAALALLWVAQAEPLGRRKSIPGPQLSGPAAEAFRPGRGERAPHTGRGLL